MFGRNQTHILSLLTGITILGVCGSPHAADPDSWGVASALGDVLASESACGLHYDQDAIKSFIAKNVAADDMEFASTLAMVTRVQESQVQKLSPSSKTAQCEQTARVARSYGFTK